LVGARVYSQLQQFLAPAELLTAPWTNYALDTNSTDVGLSEDKEAKVPKLLRAYLSVGAQICGPPALDTEFGTIDFLTLLDLRRVPRGLFSRVTPS
jgi:putative hemolysin